MNSRASKKEDNKEQSVSNAVIQQQSGQSSAPVFVDNRPQSIAQRKLQTNINNSPQVLQLKAYQLMANQHVEQGPVLQALWGSERLAGYAGTAARAIGSGAATGLSALGSGATMVGSGIVSGASTVGNALVSGATTGINAVGSGATAVASGIVSGASTVGNALVSGATTGMHAVESRATAVASGIVSGASTVGNALVSGASASLNAATSRLPAMSEQSKEKFDPRRWRLNPYFRRKNLQELGYENTHGRYHSQARHGAAHTLRNIHLRTQPLPGRPARSRDSAMANVVHPGTAIPQSPVNGRFATPGWQTYSREQAILHATANLPGVTFPAGAPPAVVPPNSYYSFSIEYQGSPAGLSVSLAGPHTATPVHFVRVGIQYVPATNQAWLIQHFPQTAAVPPSTELVAATAAMAAHNRLSGLQRDKKKDRGKAHLKAAKLKIERALMARIAAATQRIPNHTIPYNQIPVF